MKFEFRRFVFVRQEVGKLAQTALDFPPMQEDASFNLEAVKAKIQHAIASRAGEQRLGPDYLPSLSESQVFIELRDVGYPESTYTLRYFPKQDMLAGLYYWPTAGRSFEVIFIRTNP
jgi:arylsulfatase